MKRCQPCEFPREIRFGIRFSSCVVTDDLHPVQDITASCRYKKEISGSNNVGLSRACVGGYLMQELEVVLWRWMVEWWESLDMYAR